MSAFTPSSASRRSPCSKSARMKRVSQGTSAASSANAFSASGSRSIAISVPVGAEAVGDQPRVAGGAERAVDRDLPAAGVERLDELARQDRDVRAWHVKQDGQEMR